MANRKNQHFVPKVHLRKFAVDVRKKQINIWLIKKDRVVKGASISGQCSKDYFYGSDLEIENFFNSPEGIFGQVVDRLIETQNPTKDDLQSLLFLWLLQYIRSERAITEQLLVMNAVREKAALGEINVNNLEKIIGEPMSASDAMASSLKSAIDYFEIIMDLRPVLLINRTKRKFVMSDNPAVYSNKFIIKRYPDCLNWGIGSAGFYLYMPLSPGLGFLAYDRNTYELIKRVGSVCVISEDDARSLNQLVYVYSDNIIVLPPGKDDGDIIRELKKFTGMRPSRLMKVVASVKHTEQKRAGYTTYVDASDDEFGKSGGLIRMEALPPRLHTHLPKLRIRQMPKFVDTKSSAGLMRR